MRYWDEKAQAWRDANEVKSYAVPANKKPWHFATMAEAVFASNDIFRRKGILVGIVASFHVEPTHAYPEFESVQ